LFIGFNFTPCCVERSPYIAHERSELTRWKTPPATPRLLLRHVIRLRLAATAINTRSNGVAQHSSAVQMRKAGATIRLEAYRRARLEHIRHNILRLCSVEHISLFLTFHLNELKAV
jgi:hypothetical protein